MNSSARLGPISTLSGITANQAAASQTRPAIIESPRADARPRVYIAAENRLLREALARMLARRGGFEILGAEEPIQDDMSSAAELVAVFGAQVLVYNARGTLEKDLMVVRKVRNLSPQVKVLVLGLTGNEGEFVRYVRAGIDGCLLRDAAGEDVLDAVRAVFAGEAVCPGALCSVLFRYFERETTSFASAGLNRELGLTRREQQLIPLIARGLTNKEIANHFCLSEQTVKNHLYRMKQKIGAGDRLGIVQVCQEQGFFV